MRKRTVKLWRLHEDGRKLFAGTIEAADPGNSSSSGQRSWPPQSPALTSRPIEALSLDLSGRSRTTPAR